MKSLKKMVKGYRTVGLHLELLGTQKGDKSSNIDSNQFWRVKNMGNQRVKDLIVECLRENKKAPTSKVIDYINKKDKVGSYDKSSVEHPF